jgi:hypothetical protein
MFRLPLITAFATTAIFAGAAPTIANAADLDGENYSSYTEYHRGYAYRDYSIRPSDEFDEDDDVGYGYRRAAVEDPDDDEVYVEEASPSVDVDVEVGTRFRGPPD